MSEKRYTLLLSIGIFISDVGFSSKTSFFKDKSIYTEDSIKFPSSFTIITVLSTYSLKNQINN